MLKILRQLESKIPSKTPVPVVVGVGLWLIGLTLMMLAVFCSFMQWRFTFYILFVMLVFCAFLFMATVIQAVFQAFTGTIRHWRDDDGASD